MLMPPSPMQLPTQSIARGSNSLQILDQILLVCVAEIQFELRIVVVDHVEQRGEAAVVEEAALLVRPQPCETARCGTCGSASGRPGTSRCRSRSGVCRLWPGSVKSGGTWQVAHLPGAVEDRLSAFECRLVI